MLRSSIKELTGEANWFDKPISSIRDNAANTGASKLVLYCVSEYANVTVPASQNFVALSGFLEAPSVVKALENETEGAIVALLPGAAGAMHSLNTAALDGNLLLIRLAGTNEGITDSSGEQVFGLLQVDSDATDDTAFEPIGDEAAQISFVVRNPATETFQAADITVMGGLTIEYAYTVKYKLINAAADFVVSCNSFVKPPASTGTITSNLTKHTLPIAFDGQTIFTLPSAYAAGGVSTAYINGIAYHAGVHYTILGTAFTWLNYEFILENTDDAVVEYESV